uniref:Uncharacterized protein n=1 Tax=Fundulus heteroclitus TaxID=8078 RepID=A0A3Q2T2Q9_FUNHE
MNEAAHQESSQLSTFATDFSISSPAFLLQKFSDSRPHHSPDRRSRTLWTGTSRTTSENIQVKQDFDKTRYAVGKKEPEGLMTATTKGSVGSPGPAKFRMKYWGAASYLQTGNDKLGYPHRLRRLRHPLLLYSFVFSRHSTGLRPEDQAIITQRKMDLCLLGRYRRVAHNGFCENSGNSDRNTLAL